MGEQTPKDMLVVDIVNTMQQFSPLSVQSLMEARSKIYAMLERYDVAVQIEPTEEDEEDGEAECEEDEDEGEKEECDDTHD